jgi:hypothetical protein
MGSGAIAVAWRTAVLAWLAGAAGCQLPSPRAVSSQPPPTCAERPRGVVRYCSGEVPPTMADCAVCSGARGCVDLKDGTYCVDASGCDDPRCHMREAPPPPRNELLYE